MFPNILYWGDDTGDDAPLGGQVCVLIETAAPFPQDPLALGDDIIDDYLNRLSTTTSTACITYLCTKHSLTVAFRLRA
ncbi:hypothetical protein [Corynebacterium cystitidis]|nr:hypothetical protein [Corynebacterium cystitidis]